MQKIFVILFCTLCCATATAQPTDRKLQRALETTPREMATLMEKIYTGQVISDSAGKKMIRLLGRNYFDEVAISQVPPNIFVASKHGCVNASRSETLLVMAPGGPYIFSIITKD